MNHYNYVNKELYICVIKFGKNVDKVSVADLVCLRRRFRYGIWCGLFNRWRAVADILTLPPSVTIFSRISKSSSTPSEIARVTTNGIPMACARSAIAKDSISTAIAEV